MGRTKFKPRQISTTTTIEDPGVDANIPTEQAVVTALGEVIPSLYNHSQLVWTIEGVNLNIEEAKPLIIKLPYAGAGAIIEEVYIQLGTTPGAADLQINILNGGITIFTETEYIEIAVGDTAASRTTDFVNDGEISKDDDFQIEIVQGDTAAADLVVLLRYKWLLEGLEE